MRSELIADTEFKITPLAVENSSTKVIPKGNVVIATRVGLGKVCLLQQDTAINQDLRAVVPKNDKQLSVQFLFWWLKSVSHLIVAEGTGATVQGVKLPFIKSLVIPLPPLSDQKRIVAILEEAFKGLATATTNTQKNLKNARELFDSVINLVFTQESDDRRIVSLGNVCGLLGGPAFKSEDAVAVSGTQLVRMSNLYGNRLDLNRSPAFYPDSFAQTYRRYLLREGDLIISLTGTVGKEDYGYTVEIPRCDVSLLMNQRIARFESIDEVAVSRKYFLYYLRSRIFLDALYMTANGTRQANLSSVTMKKLPVVLYRKEKQEGIVKTLDELSEGVGALESMYHQQRSLIVEFKQSILHKAFSGELTSPPSQAIKEAAE